jgi:Ser/Thr protein kinase RdoA (MazF antagonist)
VLCAVERLGAPVVGPMKGRNRRFVQSLEVADERRHAVLFAHAPGHGVDPCNLTEVAAFGTAVATLHRLTDSLDISNLEEIDCDYLAETPLRLLAPYQAAGAVLDEVRSIASDQNARIGGDIPVGLCHGDLHPQNANIDDEDGAITMFDFDELTRGPHLYDLACYWRKCLLGHDRRSVAEDEWRAFLGGYETVRDVSEEERRALPAWATLRAIWTMAMPAQGIGIWGDDWLADPTYFAAHLDMIRRLAAETRAAR